MKELIVLLIALCNYGAEGCLSLNPDYPDRLVVRCETISYPSKIEFKNKELYLVVTTVTDHDGLIPVEVTHKKEKINSTRATNIIAQVRAKGIEPYFCGVVDIESSKHIHNERKI